MRKNVGNQTIAAQLVSATDGSAVTTGNTTVAIVLDAGTQTALANATHEGNGTWVADTGNASNTNGNHAAVTFVNSSAVSVCVQAWPQAFGAGSVPQVDVTHANGNAAQTPSSGIFGAILADAAQGGSSTTLTLNALTVQNAMTVGGNVDIVGVLNDGRGNLSVYAGADTAGTTTLLSRLSAARAGYLDNLSAGAVATAAKLLNYIRLLYRSDAAIATDAATELTEINADLGSGAGGVVTTTDSAQAIRDRGDAAWTTGAGGSAPTVEDIRAEMDANSTKLALITGNVALETTAQNILTDTAEIGAAGAGLTEAGGTGDQYTAIPTVGNVTNVANSGNATLGPNAHQGASLAISGNLTAGNATVSGTTALGQVTAGNVTVSGTTALGEATAGNATVSGTTALGTVTASSAAIAGNVTAGNATVSGTSALGQVTAGNVTVSGATDLGTLTAEAGNVTAMTADATKIGGNTTAATNLAASARGVVSTTVDDASASTTSFVTALTEATDDHYNGRVIVFLDGALAGQATDITDYTGATKTVTVTALTEAPANGSAFVIV